MVFVVEWISKDFDNYGHCLCIDRQEMDVNDALKACWNFINEQHLDFPLLKYLCCWISLKLETDVSLDGKTFSRTTSILKVTPKETYDAECAKRQAVREEHETFFRNNWRRMVDGIGSDYDFELSNEDKEFVL